MSDVLIQENPVRSKMRGGQAAFGLNVRLARSPDIARVAKATGHDFLFLDAQHSIFNIESIAAIGQTALAIGVSPLVRVRSLEDPDVPLLLDNCIAGIVFPDINNAAEARRAVDRCRFPPLGRRSVSGGYPQLDYRSIPVARATAALDAATLVVCMVETAEGLENLEEICAVPGVDVVHIGANDLLVSLGKPGQFDDPVIVEAMDRAVTATAKHQSFAGCGGNRDVTRQAASIQRGIRFVTTQSDIGFLAAAAARWTADLQRALQV